MPSPSVIDSFFRLRWPDGFRCPRCRHHLCYTIHTRSLPLYQCRLCGKQTSLTSGTIMHKSRTPLEKWAAAIDALASAPAGSLSAHTLDTLSEPPIYLLNTPDSDDARREMMAKAAAARSDRNRPSYPIPGCLNAVELAEKIGVSHKVAWTMLSKFRAAIGEAEAARKLDGVVCAGLRSFSPSYIISFFDDIHYRVERVAALAASVDETGKPKELKLRLAERSDLLPGQKVATAEGRQRLIALAANPHAQVRWQPERRRFPTELQICYYAARQWLVRHFNGIGTKYLQRYLDEFCFRWNTAARGANLYDEMLQCCL